MKFLFWLIVLVVLVESKPREGFKKSFRYFKITCSSSNKTCINPYCYIKNSRNDSTYSSGCNVIRPVYKFYTQVTVSFRFLSQYRQVLKWPMVEHCAFLNLTKYLHGGEFDEALHDIELPGVAIYNETFVRNMVTVVKDRIKEINPEKLHPCPLHQDDLKDHKFPSSNKFEFVKIMPDGDYRYEHKIWNDEDDNIFQKTVYENFKTGEDSFF